jgi:hypothetical protein
MKTPAETFSTNPDKRNALAAILRDPAFREALDILKDELEPESSDKEALVNPQIAVSQRHQVAGANHVLKGLRRLATAPPQAPKALPGHKPLADPNKPLTEEQLKELKNR